MRKMVALAVALVCSMYAFAAPVHETETNATLVPVTVYFSYSPTSWDANHPNVQLINISYNNGTTGVTERIYPGQKNTFYVQKDTWVNFNLIVYGGYNGNHAIVIRDGNIEAHYSDPELVYEGHSSYVNGATNYIIEYQDGM